VQKEPQVAWESIFPHGAPKLYVNDKLSQKGSAMAAWEGDDASSCVSSTEVGASALSSRRPSWQSESNPGVEILPMSLQPLSAHSGAGSRRPSWQSFLADANPGVDIGKPSLQSFSLQSCAGSRRPSLQSDSSLVIENLQPSLQPSSAQSGAGSRRPSWQSDSNPVWSGTHQPGMFSASHSGAGSRRPSWQSDSNPVRSGTRQPGIFSASALHAVGNSLRGHLSGSRRPSLQLDSVLSTVSANGSRRPSLSTNEPMTKEGSRRPSLPCEPTPMVSKAAAVSGRLSLQTEALPGVQPVRYSLRHLDVPHAEVHKNPKGLPAWQLVPSTKRCQGNIV